MHHLNISVTERSRAFNTPETLPLVLWVHLTHHVVDLAVAKLL